MPRDIEKFAAPSVVTALYPNYEFQKYKDICSLPNVFTRGDSEQVKEVLIKSKSDKALLIESILTSHPIEKPIKHRGDSSTDHFILNLTMQDAEIISNLLRDMEVQSTGCSGDTTPLASFYTSLFNKWFRYVESIQPDL